MVWYYGNEKPDSVVMKLRLGQRQYTVNFNVESAEGTQYKYRWQSVTLEPGVWQYGPLVSAIISERYPKDAMQAVVNNYLLNPENAEHKLEFDNMQVWRENAKKIAKQIIEAKQIS